MKLVDYNEQTRAMINNIADQFPDESVHAIFGGAVFIDHTDIDTIVDTLPRLMQSAKFFKWSKGIADACRTYCHICLIDPALIEAYIGMRFEALAEIII